MSRWRKPKKPVQETPKTKGFPDCFGKENRASVCEVCQYWFQCLDVWGETYIERKLKNGKNWKP